MAGTEDALNALGNELVEVRDYLTGLIVELQNRVGYLESEVRRVRDLAQSAEYLASDAKRSADDAANTARRGW